MSVDEVLPRRADARRNRAAVLEAAIAVFAERGLEAGVPEIAARAGVGKATVYRSFPTKEHLVAAVAIDGFQWFADVARAACDDPDPGPAFERVIVTIAERQAEDLAIAGTLAGSVTLPELQAARSAAQEAMATLIARGVAAGALRADATFDDLQVLFTGVSAILRERRERDPEVWRHFGRLVVDALRPR